MLRRTRPDGSSRRWKTIRADHSRPAGGAALRRGSGGPGTGIGSTAAGGSWASAGNWDSADGIAGGADNTAYFGFGREAEIAPNSSFTLDGPQTIGNLCFTTQSGAGSWSINPGSSGSLVLDDTFGPPEITVTSSSLQVTLNAVVAGEAGVEKDGAGTLALAARNTYSGQTLVKGGELNVPGSVGTGGVVAANATLSGAGIIMGPGGDGFRRHTSVPATRWGR